MADRKSPNGNKTTGKPSGNRPTGRPGTPNRPVNAPGRAPGRPPARKPGKSIVNQKQTPWGLIITTIVLVLFAGGIVAYAVTSSGNSHKNSAAGSMSTNPEDSTYVQPEIAAAKAIKGVIYHPEPDHDHTTGTVKYDTNPPTGGNHSPYWANCNGVVYTHQLANENAVHMMEHGAVWITYNPKTATKADIKTLANEVNGVDRLALTPYAGLKTPISLQAWDYQLFVQKATDPRVAAFIDALRDNPKTLPEAGVSCSDPAFKANESYPDTPSTADGYAMTDVEDTTDQPMDEQSVEQAPTSRAPWFVVIAVALIVVALAGGYLWGHHGKTSDSASGVKPNATDIGFARDMMAHHQQALTMAEYARDNSNNVLVRTMAFDIETTQSVQLGMMSGWLEQWNVAQTDNHPMSWMIGHHEHIGPNGLMPGMATPTQMTKLLSSHGRELNILFLQLMIRHHQGGIVMAQYGQLHANTSYVRLLAAQIYTNQSGEIVQMEQLLRQLGGTTLKPPQT